MARKSTEKPINWYRQLPDEGTNAFQFRKLNEEYFTLAGKLRADAPNRKYEEYTFAQFNDSKGIQVEVKTETKPSQRYPTRLSKFASRLRLLVLFRLDEDKGHPKSRPHRVYRY